MADIYDKRSRARLKFIGQKVRRIFSKGRFVEEALRNLADTRALAPSGGETDDNAAATALLDKWLA